MPASRWIYKTDGERNFHRQGEFGVEAERYGQTVRLESIHAQQDSDLRADHLPAEELQIQPLDELQVSGRQGH